MLGCRGGQGRPPPLGRIRTDGSRVRPTSSARMISSLYECSVMHARFSPRRHRFLYRIFLFALDFDEVESVGRQNALFSSGCRNIYSFRDADYLPIGEPLHSGEAAAPARVSKTPMHPRQTLKERVTSYASQHGVDISGGKVVLLTLPRVFGYLFNPVSFYFCYDRDGVPAAAIAEVTNTFREVKP